MSQGGLEYALLTALLLLVAFLVGSIPFGAIFARRRGVDIQREGSGNIGATNVARTLGKKLGALVLLLDAAKGALPVGVAMSLDARPNAIAAAALMPVLGHCFSPWLRFKGGKGVATALGVFLVLDPAATGIAMGVFALLYALSRKVSLGSVVAALAMPVALWWRQAPRGWIIAAGLISLVIVIRHRDNLRRLLRGTEQGV